MMIIPDEVTERVARVADACGDALAPYAADITQRIAGGEEPMNVGRDFGLGPVRACLIAVYTLALQSSLRTALIPVSDWGSVVLAAWPAKESVEA